MKKRVLSMLIVSIMLLCVACQSSEPNQTITAELHAEIAEVLANASYENVEILFDEIEYFEGQELEVVNIQGYNLQDYFTDREIVGLYADEVFPNLLDVKEISKDLLYDGDSRVRDDDLNILYYEKNFEDILATIDTYTDTPDLIYKDAEKYQEISYSANWIGGVYISQGVLGKYINSSDAFSAQKAIEIEKTYDCRMDDLSDSYILLDGEKTVEEAKEEMEKYLNEHYPIANRENGIENEVIEISVGKITGTDYYAFTANRTFSYNGIPFREMPADHNPPLKELVIMAECALCESNKVDVTIGLINRYTEPEHVRTIENYVSFQEVMDRVAYYLTGETIFQLFYGGVEYRVFDLDGVNLQMIPYWTFIAKNPNDDTMVKIYVDMETGETTHCEY